jgi:5-oxoprolinase (ATP-hydrolysing) subunit A
MMNEVLGQVDWGPLVLAAFGLLIGGRLIQRGKPGALIEDSDQATERALAMVECGAIITASGRHLKTPIGSICIHGDSPHAVAMARSLRLRLETDGVTIAAFAPAP